MSNDQVKMAMELETGKKVVVRRPINSDIENAMKLTSQQVGSSDQIIYSYKLTENIAKEILISVDGNTDVRRPFDEMFTLQEVAQIRLAVGELSGNSKAKLPIMTVMLA